MFSNNNIISTRNKLTYLLIGIVLSLSSTATSSSLTRAALGESAAPMQNSTIKLSAENSGVVKPQLLAQSTVNAKVLQLINGERRKVGAPPLRVNSQLTQAAQRHANDMAENDFLSHTGSDGSTMRSRIEATGYSWGRMGENVAAGQATPEAVMRSWMSSPPHRGNILNRDFTEVGIGYATEPSSQYTHYWTLVFAKPR